MVGSQTSTNGDATLPLWRATVVMRLLTFTYAVGASTYHHEYYARPVLGWVVLTTMAAWTAATVWWFGNGQGRGRRLVIADQMVVNSLVLASGFVLSPAQLFHASPLTTTVWAPNCVISAAVYGGLGPGAASGALVALISALPRGYFDTGIARDTVLLIGTGLVLGLASDTARRSTERLKRALRSEAATAERERLARSIHDSVLQVLARVRRRGTELGGEAAELARQAGEQEVALRSLVAAAPPESTDSGDSDLGSQLQMLTTAKAQVSVPATPVLLPAAITSELFSLVREALSNVEKHAGPGANAWVLLEDLDAEVVLSIRDDGPGISDGRLDAAEAEGRMGVARSIRGRVDALNGTIELQTAPGEGTEWEVRVPRPSTDQAQSTREDQSARKDQAPQQNPSNAAGPSNHSDQSERGDPSNGGHAPASDRGGTQ